MSFREVLLYRPSSTSSTTKKLCIGTLELARANKLREGDRNIAYFHHKANQRRASNQILEIINDQGETCRSQSAITTTITDFFADLFSTTNPTPTDIDDLIEGIPPWVDADMNQTLDRPPSADEIWLALKQMHPNKAPGRDDMHARFS